jgi:hypothetical protein
MFSIDGIRLKIGSVTFGKYYSGDVYEEKQDWWPLGISYYKVDPGYRFVSVNVSLVKAIEPDDFPEWDVTLKNSTGNLYQPFVLVTITESESGKVDGVHWIFSIPEDEKGFSLIFPEGTTIDVSSYFE